MSSADVTLSDEWLIVEWEDCTRTIVHSEQVCDIKDSKLYIRRGDFMVKASIVDRSPDRTKLVKTLKEAIKKRQEELMSDEENREPTDFESSSTDWEPTDDSESDSEDEVENRKRKIYLTKKKRESEPKNVLKPSNTANTPNSRTCRKQASPKQYISPTKEESLIFIPKPKKIISPTGRTVYILPNSMGKHYNIKDGKCNNSTKNAKRVTPKVRQSKRKISYPVTKTYTTKTKATKPNTPKQTHKANKPETDESKSDVEQNMPKESSDMKNTSCIPKEESKPQMKNNNEKPVTKSHTVQAKKVNEITENVKSTNCCDNNKQIKKRPDMINVVMDVEKFLTLRRSMETVYNMYSVSLNILMRKLEKPLVKRLRKAFESKMKRMEKNKTCLKKISLKRTKNIDYKNTVVAKKGPANLTNKFVVKKGPQNLSKEVVAKKRTVNLTKDVVAKNGPVNLINKVEAKRGPLNLSNEVVAKKGPLNLSNEVVTKKGSVNLIKEVVAKKGPVNLSTEFVAKKGPVNFTKEVVAKKGSVNFTNEVVAKKGPVNHTNAVLAKKGPVNLTNSVVAKKRPVNIINEVVAKKGPVNPTNAVLAKKGPVNLANKVDQKEPVNLTNAVVAKKGPVNLTDAVVAKKGSVNPSNEVDQKEPVNLTNDVVDQKANNKNTDELDEIAEDETFEDFDRSDDNILISNKFYSINTPEEPKKKKDDNLVPIGSGKTLLPKDKFRKIKWNSYTVATRGLLLAAFPRRVLATHSMTGKKSPAFMNKPAKMCLDPKKVADIIIEVMDRFKIKENLIRSVITTKCADESKMFKMRMKKLEKSSQNANN